MSESPTRCCDLVLKGGITSGILYPPAIARLAEGYVFAGLGGTSAGAICAAFAAAAELRRRRTGRATGYRLMERYVESLAADGALAGLFRPDGATCDLFDFVHRASRLTEAGRLERLGLKLGMLRRVLFHRRTLRPWIDNGFGLATGMANDRPPSDRRPPMTRWLTGALDAVADLDREVLTFGHLWRAPLPPGALGAAMRDLEGHSIRLQMVTTCLTFRRPYLLPFRAPRFAFDPEAWSRLFPARVIDHLIAASDRVAGGEALRRDGKLPLAVGADLPVVVAVRLSLALPGLFSLVPLWAVDEEDARRPLRKVWFSDGGITSNLPIHTFDVLFPRWPTLAISLQATEDDGTPARAHVGDDLLDMVESLGEERRELWHGFEDRTTVAGRALDFLDAIFRSAQMWHDASYFRLPGFRERVIEIWLRPDEGGLNLNMSRATIEDLIARGDEAGRRLRDRFIKTPADDPLSWESHRWGRLRSSLAALTVALRRFEQTVAHPMPGDRSILDYFGPAIPPAYDFGDPQRRHRAERAVRDLLAWVDSLALQTPDTDLPPDFPFDDGGPTPPLRIGSRLPM
ncbi:MAG: patatin-like phospholipase family protein [Acidobacteriota bacterium]